MPALKEVLTEFPEEIRFKFPWRKYQQRVLNDLQEHLTDGHLHIIAPPGSGKTILGLEVARRLNKPTLILAPTTAIRNQWIQRFCDLFLESAVSPHWISKDIRNPQFLTVVTYQGLHAACNTSLEKVKSVQEEIESPEKSSKKKSKKNRELDEIVKKLRSQSIGTIVVDEAHHLKNEWWHTLTQVKEQLSPTPTIVGLTATPPYDVSAAEWQRYLDLNGPVDAEISVPELIREKNLCPHQDYVYFTLPSQEENRNILDFRNNINRLFEEISTDPELVNAIENHPVWLDPLAHLDWIYDNLSYYSASLIFLSHNQQEVTEDHLEVIGDKDLEIPKLNFEWLQTLLDFYLFREKTNFAVYEEHQKRIENKLRRNGALERRQIDFFHNRRVTGSISSSISKLNGIKKIVDFEYDKLGRDLRMVVLTDYIRKEFYINSTENNLNLNKIGVLPIFEKLRRENRQNKKIGVLTGSMIILPGCAYPAFEAKAAELGIAEISSTTVPFDNNYLLINQSTSLKHKIVHIVTHIFQKGEIEVLVGTKSLLGEGWDAPAINSLILASFVGSFVLSNQMRGRAIRTEFGNSHKTANIWHLVCIDPTAANGGDDYELLRRRFRSFVGIGYGDESSIENGTGRLNLPENLHHQNVIDSRNRKTFDLAADRESLGKRWHKGLEAGVNLVEEIKIPFPREQKFRAVKSMYLNRTIKNLAATLLSGLAAYLEVILENIGRIARNIRSWQDFYFFLTLLGIGGVVLFGRKTYRTFRLYLSYRDISKDIRQIGQALLKALVQAGTIHSEESKLEVHTSVDDYGAVYCHLEGGTTFEKSVFILALQEVIGPVENPRYVIIRKNSFMKLLDQKDYHSVPELLDRNKKLAEHLREQWENFVGPCELVFTRSLEGRKLLLKSRVKSLASQLNDEIEHVSKWR